MPEHERKTPAAGERIAKVMARAGVCSLRQAEAWIAAGRVQINDRLLDTPARNVTQRDRITVDGKPLPRRDRTRLWLYHKPKGLIVARRDPQRRPTVFKKLPKDLPRVSAIGRLDYNTEGLLLLTNDGGLKRALELPATGWLRRYRVRAHGRITQEALDGLVDGVVVDGIRYGPVEAVLERQQGANAWLAIGIREGKNREVKAILRHLGLEVGRLIRTGYGPFLLADLPRGEVTEVPSRLLQERLGREITRQSGADFDAPIRQGAKTGPSAAKPSSRNARPGDLPQRGVRRRRKPGQVVDPEPVTTKRPAGNKRRK